VLTYWPATHDAHGVHPVAFVVALKVPEAHALQSWLVVAVPATLTYWPAVQAVHSVQVDAFALWLHVPVPHAVHT
jgi:hypothetical protein